MGLLSNHKLAVLAHEGEADGVARKEKGVQAGASADGGHYGHDEMMGMYSRNSETTIHIKTKERSLDDAATLTNVNPFGYASPSPSIKVDKDI